MTSSRSHVGERERVQRHIASPSLSPPPPSPKRGTPRPRTHEVVEGRRRTRRPGTRRTDGETGFSSFLVGSPSARSRKRGKGGGRWGSFVRRRAAGCSSRSWRRDSTKRAAGWPLSGPDAARALLPNRASSGLALALLEGVYVATLLLTLLTLRILAGFLSK